MSDPYRSDVEALRAENIALREENARLRRGANAASLGRRALAGSWAAVLVCDVGGLLTAPHWLNGSSDGQVYLGGAIVAALIAVNAWQLVRTLRGMVRNRE